MQSNKNIVELKYLYTLVNGDNQNTKEYLFKKPTDVKIDGYNNIYVTEYHGSNIFKYTKDGQYLSTLGRVGNGPGEFNEIRTYDIFQNKIIVCGSANNLTEYSTDCKLLRTIPLSSDTYYMRQICNYTSNKYLIMKFRDNTAVENIFYIYDNKLEKQITSFGHPSIMFDTNSPIYQNERSALNILVLANGDVVIAKQYYDGKIYCYDHNNNWKHKVYSSNKEYRNYRILSPDEIGEERYNNLRRFYDNKTNKQIGILLRTLSVGLLRYENRYILNFVVQCNNSNLEAELGIEVYSIKCEYLGYYRINNTNIISKGIRTKVFCIDNDNCVLIHDNSPSGIPQIKKFKLNIDIK